MKKNKLLIATAITIVSLNLVGCSKGIDVVNNYVELVSREAADETLKTINLDGENLIDITLGAGNVDINLIDGDKVIVKTTI